MSINFLSLNVKGLNSPFKREALRRQALSKKVDILFIQKTHLFSLKDHHFTSNKFPHVFSANATSKKRGVLIAVKDNIDFQKVELHLDPDGHDVILLCTIN